MRIYSFCVWFISFNIMSLSPIHVATNDRIFLYCGWMVFHYIEYTFFIHWPMDGHMGRFYILPIVNSGCNKRRGTDISSTYYSTSFEYILINWIDKLYGSSASLLFIMTLLISISTKVYENFLHYILRCICYFFLVKNLLTNKKIHVKMV